MESSYSTELKLSNKRPARRLRAVVEVISGELKIYPIANSDTEEAEIMDALRFLREGFQE
jgi:hypothetical protein